MANSEERERLQRESKGELHKSKIQKEPGQSKFKEQASKMWEEGRLMCSCAEAADDTVINRLVDFNCEVGDENARDLGIDCGDYQ